MIRFLLWSKISLIINAQNILLFINALLIDFGDSMKIITLQNWKHGSVHYRLPEMEMA